MRRIGVWLEGSAPSFLGYSRSAVAKRLTQRAVQLGFVPFIQECARRSTVDPPLVATAPILRFGGLVVGAKYERMTPDHALVIRSAAEFLLHWCHVLSISALAALTPRRRNSAATLLFGVGTESLTAGGDDSRFVEFCDRGPIAPLSAASRVIVQSTATISSTRPDRFEYTRFPLFGLLLESTFNLTDYCRFLLSHFRSFGTYFVGILRYPLIAMLGRDFAYHALLMHLDRKRLIESIVITNANYSAQPLWMNELPGRRFQTHMVWYAQNTIPFVFADDPIRADLPHYRHIRVDVSWVWTKEYASYLKSLDAPGVIHIVGPILWHLPAAEEAPRRPVELTLVVFDVTPVRDDVAAQFGFFGNYYSAANMKTFLCGILHVAEELRKSSAKQTRILLKVKRGYSAIHDPGYIAMLEEMRTSGGIELVPFDVNMYSLVSGADLVIAVPYSSPAYVAHHLGVPAVFFDAVSELLPTHDKRSEIGFAAGQDDLLKVARSVMLPIRAGEAVS